MNLSDSSSVSSTTGESSLLATLTRTLFYGYCFIGLAAVLYGYFWRRSKYFDKKGIPHPDLYSVFSGNLKDLQDGTKPHSINLQKWTEKFGDLFGYFEGGLRVIFTSRTDVIRDVYVKKFDKFHGRKPINPFPFNPDTDVRASVFISRGIRWKRLRSLFEPSFNMKMTRVHQKVFRDSNKHVVEYLQNNLDKTHDFHDLTLEWVSDIVERLCVGKKESTFGSGVNEVARLVDLFFHPPSYWENKLMRFYVSTHEFTNYTQYMHKFIRMLVKNPIYQLEAKMMVLIKDKMKNRKPGDEPNDILDIFVDARASDEEVDELKNLNKTSISQFKTYINKQLTEEEILAMSTMTILAAVETTHTTLKTFFYSLAQNPKCQQKLCEEIDQYIETEEDNTMDTVLQMPYLDWCLKESQRLHPVAYAAISRECMETTEVGDDGFVIDKGVFVYANYWALHRDPKHWGEDVLVFDPERWDPAANRLPSNLDAVYGPFGHLSAPRTCPGRHFATSEVKLSACSVLKNFTVEFDPSHNDQDECGILVYSMPKVQLRVQPRESTRHEVITAVEEPMWMDIDNMKKFHHHDMLFGRSKENNTPIIENLAVRQRSRCG